MKKIVFISIIFVVVFGLYKLLSLPPKSTNSEAEINPVNEENADRPDLIVYWGDGCPHCENVEKFISENQVGQKIRISQKEVYKDTNNQKELVEKVNQFCPDLGSNGGVGVPLAFDVQNNVCIQGDTHIIDFLKQKI